jgi:hypothetical protein
MFAAAAARGRWKGRASHALSYLCCLLTFLAGTPVVTLCGLATPRALLATTEGEELPTNEEHGKDSQVAKRGEDDLSRQGRLRRLARRADPSSLWLVQLTHHRPGAPGYDLPASSPFECGAQLPLRC